MGINGSPSMSQVAAEFGGSAPHALSEYRGVSFSDGSYAPSSGTISLNNFRNKSKYAPPREPASGFASSSSSNFAYMVGHCSNYDNRLVWNGVLVTASPTLTLPITVGGWTYHHESTAYSSIPAYAVCGASVPYPGAYLYRVYRIGT